VKNEKLSLFQRIKSRMKEKKPSKKFHSSLEFSDEKEKIVKKIKDTNKFN
jgi:hypothetical protein